jgi:hypothetical protein
MIHPLRPDAGRKVLVGHPNLVCNNVFNRNIAIVETISESVPDAYLWIMNDALSKQSAPQSEVKIFDTPGLHMGIENPVFRRRAGD